MDNWGLDVMFLAGGMGLDLVVGDTGLGFVAGGCLGRLNRCLIGLLERGAGAEFTDNEGTPFELSGLGAVEAVFWSLALDFGAFGKGIAE